MRPVSARFRAAIGESHNIATRARVLSIGHDPVEVPVAGGSVTLDISAASLGRMDISIVDDGSGLVPTSAGSLLAPYGNELQIERGIAYPDGERELVSLGVFRIDTSSIDDTPDSRVIALTGLDRSGQVVAARFEQPHVIAAGTRVEDAIVSTLLPIIPQLQWQFPGSEFLTPMLIGEEGGDRWQFCQAMAEACGLVLYFDGDGVLRLMPLLGGNPVAQLVDGEDGVLVSAKREWRREGSYNIAIVTGENTGEGVPVRAVAMDVDPASPTFVSGPFGRVPVFYQSQFVRTVAQAQAAADALLTRQLGTTETVSFGTIVDPCLEPGDTVCIRRRSAGINRAHTIDQLTIGLSASDVMSGATRATQVIE